MRTASLSSCSSGSSSFFKAGSFRRLRECTAAARTGQSLSESASFSASSTAGSLSLPSSKAADARPETPASVRIDCIDAMPSPKPGTGANRAPCRTANRNVLRGVCIIRKASRFCLEKKLDEVLLSPARTASSACLPAGSFRDHSVTLEAGDFVHFFVERDPILQVLELHGAADFGQDGEGVRIPLDHDLALRDRIAIVDQQLSAVHDRVALALAVLVVDHCDRTLTVHDDQVSRLRLDR